MTPALQVILASELDPVTVQRHQTTFADGNAMGVTGLVTHHYLCLVQASVGRKPPNRSASLRCAHHQESGNAREHGDSGSSLSMKDAGHAQFSLQIFAFGQTLCKK